MSQEPRQQLQEPPRTTISKHKFLHEKTIGRLSWRAGCPLFASTTTKQLEGGPKKSVTEAHELAPRRRSASRASEIANTRGTRGIQRELAAMANIEHIPNMVARNYLPSRYSKHLGAALGAVCLLLLLALASAENKFDGASTSAQQDPPGFSAAPAASAAALTESLAASASSNDYQIEQQHQNQQHQNGQQPSKSKKIQIVYIKVPLAKLRPSLVSHGDARGATNTSASRPSEYSETTADFKSRGSQTPQQQQQQQFSASDEQQFMSSYDAAHDNQHQSSANKHESSLEPKSFLIPMALVQTTISDQQQSSQPPPQQQPSSKGHSQTSGADMQRQPTFMMQEQKQEADLMNLGHAGSQLHAAHAQPWPSRGQASSNQHMISSLNEQLPMGADLFYAGVSEVPRSPSLRAHQMMRQQLAPSHGFMSSFLLGEKEKMTQAAMRLQQQQYRASQSILPAAATLMQPITARPQVAAQMSASPSNSHQQSSTTSTSLDPKGPGGLMPSIIAPLSRMPDNAIGQAYGAAVGIALPAESGSPANLLSSPSTNSYGMPQQQQQQQQQPHQHQARGAQWNENRPGNQTGQTNYHGGNSGTAGNGAYSSGTGSSTSFGESGPGQQGSSSSGNNYQSSSQGFDASALSSGYGNGISTSGVSAALSDYPAAPSAASSPYNHPSSQQAGRAPGSQYSMQAGLDEQHLKQAKKTIIPIVVQVEHAILENNQAAANQAAMAYQHQHQQQQQQQQQRGGTKYSGNRTYRQMGGGGGKRMRQGPKSASNQLYGAATNEVAHYGDIPPGAQWVNAANAYDINQITAQINAENAASAAAALAQADMALGQGSQAGYTPPNGAGFGPLQQQASAMPAHHQAARHPGQGARPGGNQAASAYAAGLQSAASALLANTHPVIQAAASGSLASVSKLGAKLGEMIALPSMQMPGSIASIGQSLPSAFSSLTNQVSAQLGQAVQQAAKEHPTASAFARQVAQQAGIQLPNYGQPQQQSAALHQQQQQQGAISAGQLSPQAQLQNLKLGIGHSLQSAASSLIGLNQKANAASSPQSSAALLAGANQAALSAAIKQLSAISPAAAHLAGQLAGVQQAAASSQQQTVVAAPQSMGAELDGGQSASQQPNQQQLSMLNQFLQQQQQVYRQLANLQQASAGGLESSASQLEPATSSSKPVKASSSFKSKFLSFFQPPKFISNLIGWNDRADARNDQASQLLDMELPLAAANFTTTSLAPNSTRTTLATMPLESERTTTTIAAQKANATSMAATTGAASATTTTLTTAAAAASTASTATTAAAKMQDVPKASTAAPTSNNVTSSAQS